jgi:hypothetical protein
MKRCLLLSVVLLLVFPTIAGADDFPGLPLIPGGKVIKKTDALMVIETDLSHDQVLEFFRNVLKDAKDIKIREWEEMTYIEDDGNRPWHSIAIPRDKAGKITVTIKKDSWAWILSTLTLRYIAVFVVLMIIYLSISVSGKIISGAVNRAEAKKKAQAT